MFSKSGTVLVAILLASSAAAAPLSAAQFDGVQAVVDAIKVQLKAQNISDDHIVVIDDIVVDEIEAQLKDVGFLNDNTISKLNDEIKSMISVGGISAGEIAEILIEELRSEDAIQKREEDGITKNALVIDPNLVMTSEGGISVDEIAEILIEELRSEDGIRKRDQEGIAEDALVIDPDLVKRVMARETEALTFCPPGAKHQTLCCPF